MHPRLIVIKHAFEGGLDLNQRHPIIYQTYDLVYGFSYFSPIFLFSSNPY